jgi:hypothetical protein
MIVDSLLHEAVDFFRNFLSGIKQCLLLIILPVKSKIHHSDGFPEIAQLGARAIYYPSDFVSNYKFQVLLKTQKFYQQNS